MMLSVAMLKHPVHVLALGFGSGLAPKAPGTFGTVIGVVFYFLLMSASLSLVSYLVVTAVLFVAGIWICAYTARALGVHDHPAIVWDEVVGYLITMIAAPAGAGWLLTGFVLFRLFDIWKPWPIRWLDHKVAGGLGIMIDDALAGLYAALAIQVIAYGFA